MPTYTNNTPQANQQIAATQPLILENFQYIKQSIEQEHNFDVTDPTKTYHKYTSMPNISEPTAGSLPAGTNGQYYVNNGNAKYFDNVNPWVLSIWNGEMTGTVNIPAYPTATNIGLVLPQNVQGMVILSNATTNPKSSVMGTFITDTTSCYACSLRVKVPGSSDDYPIELLTNGAATRIIGRAYSSSWENLSYKFMILYRYL